MAPPRPGAGSPGPPGLHVLGWDWRASPGGGGPGLPQRWRARRTPLGMGKAGARCEAALGPQPKPAGAWEAPVRARAWGRGGPPVASSVGARGRGRGWGWALTFRHQERLESLDALGSLVPCVFVGRRALSEDSVTMHASVHTYGGLPRTHSPALTPLQQPGPGTRPQSCCLNGQEAGRAAGRNGGLAHQASTLLPGCHRGPLRRTHPRALSTQQRPAGPIQEWGP